MLLHKPQVYRHLLFNRLEYRDHGIDVSVNSFVKSYKQN